jgi:cell wall assembly regulator SMI1
MKRFRRSTLTLLVVIAALIVVLVVRIGGRMLLPAPGELYPRAPAMPPAVPEPVEDLLERFERILRDRAPDVLASMQPGLTDVRIDELQSKHGFVLPHDLRALYRWRNGSPRDSRLDVFADHQFVALDEALSARDIYRRQSEDDTPAQRRAHATFSGHRDEWLDLIVDLAGDGYFFDPGRSEAEGSFFFCFAEDGSYVFFPTFRNFLAATIAGHESGVLKFASHGAETVDYVRARELWCRYGAANPRGEEGEP